MDVRVCLRSFFKSHFDDILSENVEKRQSIATAMLRSFETFAAKIEQNGVRRIDGKQTLNDLKQAVAQTIVYLDLFDFAPTLLEVEKWLLKTPSTTSTPPSLTEIENALRSHPQISTQNGVYFLHGREQLVEKRKQKYDYTDTKWKHARLYIRLLALMPAVESIWLTNSMGWGNARKESDIDLCIITSPRHIWTARFFTTALMKLFRQRPKEQSRDKALCLSFYLTADHLCVERHKLQPKDIHFSFWVTQMYPVYTTTQYLQFQKKNTWLNNTFAHLYWTDPIPQRLLMQSKAEKVIKKILEWCSSEALLKKIQLTILPSTLRQAATRGSAVVISDDILKLHTNDNRQTIQQQWENRSEKLHA